MEIIGNEKLECNSILLQIRCVFLSLNSFFSFSQLRALNWIARNCLSQIIELFCLIIMISGQFSQRLRDNLPIVANQPQRLKRETITLHQLIIAQKELLAWNEGIELIAGQFQLNAMCRCVDNGHEWTIPISSKRISHPGTPISITFIADWFDC